MANSHESKLDAVMKAIKALIVRTKDFIKFVTGVGTNSGVEISQPMQYIAV
jgi:hypothetical protein